MPVIIDFGGGGGPAPRQAPAADPPATPTYLVPEVDEKQRQLLANAGVVFHDWGKDIIVEEPGLALLLKTLKAKVLNQSATDLDGLKRLSLAFGESSELEQAARPTAQAAVDPRYAASRMNYVKVCASRLVQYRKELEDRARAQKTELGTLEAGLFQHMRAEVVVGGEDSAALEERLSAEFERIEGIDSVAAVRAIAGAVLVYTHELHAMVAESKERHELGKFLIVIRYDGSDEVLRCFNLTRQVDAFSNGMQAPTVFSDGRFCVSELRETLVELTAQLEFAAVAELAIQFIESGDESSLNRFISRWPLEIDLRQHEGGSN